MFVLFLLCLFSVCILFFFTDWAILFSYELQSVSLASPRPSSSSSSCSSITPCCHRPPVFMHSVYTVFTSLLTCNIDLHFLAYITISCFGLAEYIQLGILKVPFVLFCFFLFHSISVSHNGILILCIIVCIYS
jgi:hypothetical protein